MSLLDPVLGQIRKLWTRVDQMPVIRRGTVVQVSPLLVELDGDIDTSGSPVSTPAQSIIPVRVGARVECVEQHRRVRVLATKSSGPVAVASGRVVLSTSNIAAGASAVVTVTFPAGRFTVEPIILLSTSSGRLNTQADDRSVSSFRFVGANFTTGAAGAGLGDPSGTIYGFWAAIQMQAGSANG